MEYSKPKAHQCSVYSKDANLICKGCKDTPDGAIGLTAVYYCGTTCQSLAWPTHKPHRKVAKDRRALYRAGDIAQDLFFIFDRITWMWPIERVEKNDSQWLVVDNQQERVAKALLCLSQPRCSQTPKIRKRSHHAIVVKLPLLLCINRSGAY